MENTEQEKKKLASTVRVKNQLGIHTRPATAIVKLLHKTPSEVLFTHKGNTINAKSILSIMMLAVQYDDPIEISIEGEDAEEIMKELHLGFEECFGER